MSCKSRRSSGNGLKIVGALGLAALGGVLLYQRFKPEIVSPLPEAIDSSRTNFSTELAGRVSYYVDRQSQGRPLLLVHSVNAAPSSFELKPLFEHYRASRPVYSLELPGFGFSERSSERVYSPGLYAQTIIDMLEMQIGEPADVIALSLGCEFVARAALRRPDLFRSLAFISPTGFNAQPIDLPGDKIHPILSQPLWSQPIFELLTIRPSIRYFLQKNFVGEVPEAMIDYAYATSHQPEARVVPLYFLSGQLFTPDIRPAIYERLTTPTLVLYDRDPNIAFDMLPDLLDKNKAWQAVRMTPSLGLPHWELLPETTAALDRFWAEV